MIAYFPYPYPDELFYSWLARFAVRGAYSGSVNFTETIFTGRYINSNLLFASQLSDDILKVINKYRSIEEIILFHTMFPYYSRYITAEEKKTALEYLVALKPHPQHVLPIAKSRKVRTLSHCPVCANDDYNNYGEAYFHRVHQIPELTICPFHKCRLIENKISEHNFIGLEQIRKPEDVADFVSDGLLVEFTEKLQDLFFGEINFNQTIDFSGALQAKIRRADKFVSKYGRKIKMGKLYEECKKAADGSETENFIPEPGRFRFVIQGKFRNPAEICLIEMLVEKIT